MKYVQFSKRISEIHAVFSVRIILRCCQSFWLSGFKSSSAQFPLQSGFPEKYVTDLSGLILSAECHYVFDILISKR